MRLQIYFARNQLSKPALFYQIPTGYNAPIIDSPKSAVQVRKIYFTVVLSVYIIVLYHFYMKQLFTNRLSFHFKTKDSNVCVYVHSWSPNDGDRNQQNN